MNRVIIAQTPTFTLTSWGNGLAYALDHVGQTEGVFVQGDDATQFWNEFIGLERIKPTTQASLAELWWHYAPDTHQPSQRKQAQ